MTYWLNRLSLLLSYRSNGPTLHYRTARHLLVEPQSSDPPSTTFITPNECLLGWLVVGLVKRWRVRCVVTHTGWRYRDASGAHRLQHTSVRLRFPRRPSKKVLFPPTAGVHILEQKQKQKPVPRQPCLNPLIIRPSSPSHVVRSRGHEVTRVSLPPLLPPANVEPDAIFRGTRVW